MCSSCETGFYLRQDGQACLPQSQLLAACDSSNTLGTMQAFTAAACASYPTPVALEFTKIGCLEDERDGKLYEVRKFADDKCWMVI